MGIQNYGKVEKGRYKKLKKRITGIVIIALIAVVGAGVIGVLVSDGEGYQQYVSVIEENHTLKERVAELEAQVAELQGTVAEKDEYIASIPTIAPTPYEPGESEMPAATQDSNLESPRE